eukprot:COSAG05_NODE_2754_length_2682_cov_1.552846_3_plen_230_part_00
MAADTWSSLESLFIFGTDLGQQEGREHDKILCYYPDDAPEYQQTRNAGLAAALVGFTSNFSPDQPCETVVTQKTIQTFHYCEAPSVWLVLTMKKGGAPVAGADKAPADIAASSMDGAADDGVLRAKELARLCWESFVMFFGSAASIIDKAGSMRPPPTKADLKKGNDGWAPVRAALGNFMQRYLPGMKGLVDRPDDILTTLGGMRFLPVDKQSYLRIQLMINALEMRFR